MTSPPEDIRRLESELYEARSAIIRLAPKEAQELLSSFYHCESRETTYRWEDDVADKIIETAKVIPPEHAYASERAYCPLCGDGSTSPYSTGFSIPEGLRRHLVGYGNVRQCDVMRAACSLARDYWHRQFHEAEEAERTAGHARLVLRRKTETLYRTAPDLDPELLDARTSLYGAARSASELAWAEKRLEELGFQFVNESNVKSYIYEQENLVVYADPRNLGRIDFAVFNKPLPKRSRAPRLRMHRHFHLLDAWKKDIRGKFQTRLAEITEKSA